MTQSVTVRLATRAPIDATAWLAAWLAALLALPVHAAPLTAVMFEDAPSLSLDSLLPAYRSALGGPLDEAVVQRVADGVVSHYRGQGYLAPAPRVLRVLRDAGVLIMAVQEPRVEQVQVRGREHAPESGFWELVRELKAIRPLSRQAFAAWLERANGSGVGVRGTLVRSSVRPHEYVAVLQIAERRWQGLVHVDNRGPAQLGHEIAQLSVSYRWPREELGFLRLYAAAAADHERLRFLGIAGGHRLRDRGDALKWKYARSTSTLPIVDAPREVDYERERAELTYELPLLRRTRQRADVFVGLRSYDLDQFLDDGRRLRRDRIRALELGFDGIAVVDGGSRHSLSLLASRGLEGLGASLAPPGAKEDFTALEIEYGFRRRLDDRWSVFADIVGQFSPDRLPSSERFFIGGRSLGGAFDPATLGGDQGLGARVGTERRFAMPHLPTLTAFGYYDHGWVWSHDPARPADHAGSAGLGVRGSVAGLSWQVEVGAPVRDPETPTLLNDEARVFFSLTQRF